MHFIEKFDRENIDGQHLRPPVLAIPLETIEKKLSAKSVNLSKIFYGYNACIKCLFK